MGVDDDGLRMSDSFITLPDDDRDVLSDGARQAIGKALGELDDRYEDQNEVRSRVYRVRCESGVRIRITYRSDEWLSFEGPQAA